MLSSAPRDRYPPRGRGSNYEREKWCHGCQAVTTHLFDHGRGLHRCTECDL